MIEESRVRAIDVTTRRERGERSWRVKKEIGKELGLDAGTRI
jgi:hypothetical protein